MADAEKRARIIAIQRDTSLSDADKNRKMQELHGVGKWMVKAAPKEEKDPLEGLTQEEKDSVTCGICMNMVSRPVTDLSGNKRNGAHNGDQDFSRYNQAIKKSCEEGLPVRVVRSCKEKRSAYAPKAEAVRELQELQRKEEEASGKAKGKKEVKGEGKAEGKGKGGGNGKGQKAGGKGAAAPAAEEEEEEEDSEGSEAAEGSASEEVEGSEEAEGDEAAAASEEEEAEEEEEEEGDEAAAKGAGGGSAQCEMAQAKAFAPVRFDGIYRVLACWRGKGHANFLATRHNARPSRSSSQRRPCPARGCGQDLTSFAKGMQVNTTMAGQAQSAADAVRQKEAEVAALQARVEATAAGLPDPVDGAVAAAADGAADADAGVEDSDSGEVEELPAPTEVAAGPPPKEAKAQRGSGGAGGPDDEPMAEAAAPPAAAGRGTAAPATAAGGGGGGSGGAAAPAEAAGGSGGGGSRWASEAASLVGEFPDFEPSLVEGMLEDQGGDVAEVAACLKVRAGEGGRYLFVRCDNSPAPWSSEDCGDKPRLQATAAAGRGGKRGGGRGRGRGRGRGAAAKRAAEAEADAGGSEEVEEVDSSDEEGGVEAAAEEEKGKGKARGKGKAGGKAGARAAPKRRKTGA
ncbi:putative E3 ubiquitin-protein ligase [Tetrabaena socialis]|uniref:Putative E3 ubiquitin-protein ligase n=1 Tax=Tetrabaena socialis TaxID=47790 RepID=A0A2J7ZTX1_9CHLO|nr:putative E3 ubiquitin-protein ligase [Tetrabaena socialis]|eukprot:PNH03688.1 putative E3 ubiquitin-protein ligase [Tetrabaena socialis]